MSAKPQCESQDQAGGKKKKKPTILYSDIII